MVVPLTTHHLHLQVNSPVTGSHIWPSLECREGRQSQLDVLTYPNRIRMPPRVSILMNYERSHKCVVGSKSGPHEPPRRKQSHLVVSSIREGRQSLLDDLTYLNGTQLSPLVSILTNYERRHRCVVGHMLDLQALSRRKQSHLVVPRITEGRQSQLAAPRLPWLHR